MLYLYMINLLIFCYLLINSQCFIINKTPAITRSFILLNKVNNYTQYNNIDFKRGLNLTFIRNEIKKDEMKEKNGLNITAIREYLRNKLDNNSTNIKNQSQ